MKNEFDYLNDAAVDLSEYSAAELTEKERLTMKKEVLNRTKKKSRAKKYIAVAAAAALVAAMTQFAFAQGFVEKIVKIVSTGYNTVIETDDSDAVFTLPESIKGRVFDRNGDPITEITGGSDENEFEIYDENGVKYDPERWIELLREAGVIGADADVSVSSAYSGKLVPNSDDGIRVFTTPEEFEDFKSGLNFKLFEPEYLPSGYAFLYAEGFTDDDGRLSGDYAVVGYSNGSEVFTVHERVINENTKYTTSYDSPVTETDIHGCTAVKTDYSIMWEENGVSVDILSGNSSVTGDELLKIAESMK